MVALNLGLSAVFFYKLTSYKVKSKDISKKIIMNNVKIKKSFLNILPPPIVMNEGKHSY